MAGPELQRHVTAAYNSKNHNSSSNCETITTTTTTTGGAIRRSTSTTSGYDENISCSVVGGGAIGKRSIVDGNGSSRIISRVDRISGGGGSSCGSSSGGGGGGHSSRQYGGDGEGSSSIGGRSTCRIGGGGASSNDALIVKGSSQIEIIVDPRKCSDHHHLNKKSSLDDIEQGSNIDGASIGPHSVVDGDIGENGSQHTRRIRHRNRPLFRRFVSYVRTAFQGVHFTSSNDSELEELENLPPRYRPDSLSALCRATRFTESEIKRIYRGFKAECPTGVVKEETFKIIYASFFPQGANTGLYAHYIFNTLDQDNSGIVSFEDFVQGLSVLSRGSVDEKLRWTFSLYDINGDGYITKDEMTDIVTAIFELMGRLPDTCPDEERIKEKVDRLFEKMDINGDGLVTLDEFLDCCRNDTAISQSIAVFDTTF